MPRIMPREGQPSEKGNSPSEQGWANCPLWVTSLAGRGGVGRYKSPSYSLLSIYSGKGGTAKFSTALVSDHLLLQPRELC